jgi:feruloyl esterase
MVACGGGDDPPRALACDDGLKGVDLGDSLAKVTYVKSIKKGDDMPALNVAHFGIVAPKAAIDMCLVKVLVGPGKPGNPASRSTSSGIGIELLLPAPATWNERFVGVGNGGYAGGGGYKSTATMGYSTYEAQPLAEQGYATAATDDGHGDTLDDFAGQVDGSFALNPDRSLNTVLLEDFAHRALHETAVKSKALIKAYYGKAAKYAYFNGTSSGGREAMMLAQRYPTDYNGILSAMPAMNWTSFIPSDNWPQIVMQQDLGGPIDVAKLEAAHNASVAACDTSLTGQPDGYIADPAACRYDPTKDTAMLCVASGGSNATASCLTLAEARAMNKIWYGPRLDGTMVDPGLDNGWNPQALAPGQLWFGFNRGTPQHPSPFNGFASTAAPTPFVIGTDWIAITLQNPAYSTPLFVNETGNGQDLWKTIGYTGPHSFPEFFLQSRTKFDSLIATDNPDLSAFKAAGGKLLHHHGAADALIPAGGSVQYYERVKARMGLASINDFYRFYLAPGYGHGVAAAPNVPVPGGSHGGNSGYYNGPNNALLSVIRDWVENGRAPDSIEVKSDATATPARTRLWCAYPKKLKYRGGNVNVAASFVCE